MESASEHYIDQLEKAYVNDTGELQKKINELEAEIEELKTPQRTTNSSVKNWKRHS